MDERRLAVLATPQIVVRAPTPVPARGTWSIDKSWISGPHHESCFFLALDVAMPIPERAPPGTMLVH